MSSQTKQEHRQMAAFTAAALIAPLTHTASSSTWLTVLTAGGACLLLRMALNACGREPEGWIEGVRRIWNSVVLCSVLRWSDVFWQVGSGQVILLGLAAWAALGSGRGIRAGCVLLWPVGLILGAVLLSAVPEIKVENLKPELYLPDGPLTAVCLLPMLYRQPHREKQTGIWLGVLGYGILAAGATAGILSPSVSGRMNGAFYEMGRTLSLFGVAERFESLIAIAMMIGYFITAVYLLKDGVQNEGGAKWIWAEAAFSAVLYLSGYDLEGKNLAIGCILIWVVLPALTGLKNSLKK